MQRREATALSEKTIIEIERLLAGKPTGTHCQIATVSAPIAELLDVRELKSSTLAVRLKFNLFGNDRHDTTPEEPAASV